MPGRLGARPSLPPTPPPPQRGSPPTPPQTWHSRPSRRGCAARRCCRCCPSAASCSCTTARQTCGRAPGAPAASPARRRRRPPRPSLSAPPAGRARAGPHHAGAPAARPAGPPPHSGAPGLRPPAPTAPRAGTPRPRAAGSRRGSLPRGRRRRSARTRATGALAGAYKSCFFVTNASSAAGPRVPRTPGPETPSGSLPAPREPLLHCWGPSLGGHEGRGMGVSARQEREMRPAAPLTLPTVGCFQFLGPLTYGPRPPALQSHNPPDLYWGKGAQCPPVKGLEPHGPLSIPIGRLPHTQHVPPSCGPRPAQAQLLSGPSEHQRPELSSTCSARTLQQAEPCRGREDPGCG